MPKRDEGSRADYTLARAVVFGSISTPTELRLKPRRTHALQTTHCRGVDRLRLAVRSRSRLDALCQPRRRVQRELPGQAKSRDHDIHERNTGRRCPPRCTAPADALGRYSTTVVDYREHREAARRASREVPAAKGANQQDGDTCQNDFRVDVAGATDHAVWNYMKRDGVKITQLHVSTSSSWCRAGCCR